MLKRRGDKIKMKKKNLKTVALIIDFQFKFYRSFLIGVATYMNTHANWRVYSEDWVLRAYTGRKRMFNPESGWPPDGIMGVTYDKQQVKQLLSLGIPLIILPIKDLPKEIPAVLTDDDAIGKMAAKYLLERGFKSFGFCGFDNMYWSQGRARGFTQKLEQAGFKTNLYKYPRKRTDRYWKNEKVLIRRWLKSLPKPVAIMACNDDRSQHVIEAAKSAHFKIPEDIAVIGVDNDPMLSELPKPSISSIDLNVTKAGYEAASLLDKMMSSKTKKSKQNIIIEPTYVVTRRSTDIIAVEDPVVAQALEYINDNAKEPIQVSEVAEAVAISRRALELKFKTILNRSILDEIRRSRVELAVKLLLDTTLTLSQIALALNYRGPRDLSRNFQKIKYMSPLNYRKKHSLL